MYANDLLEVVAQGTRYRVIDFDYATDSVWLFPMSDGSHMPVEGSLHALEGRVSAGEVVRVMGSAPTVLLKPSEAAIKVRDASFEMIKPLVATRDIFAPSSRNALINERAAELQCSPRTLIRLLRLYWSGGQTRTALLPKFHARGSTHGTTSNRGRPPKYINRPIYQVTEHDFAIFKRDIDRKYLKGKTATVAGTYRSMVCEHYSVVGSDGVLEPRPEGELPTIEQFRRFFHKNYTRERVVRSREGDAEFALNHAPKLGRAALAVMSAGDNFEIDATIADVFLVSSHDRSVIVGKPTTYLLVDSKTWLIGGFYVGFEAPSWPAALQAIVSLSEDKRALCERYGVPYRPEDWPADGVLPKQITGDRGEMIGRDSSRLADGLEVIIKNLPSKMAQRKPHVECGFKLIQRPMAEHVPGYEPPENFHKRQGKHYDKDASLTLDEFTGIVLRSIIRFNNTPQNDYPLTPAQTLAEVMPIPITLWNHEIRVRAGALPRYPAEFLRQNLLPSERAAVTRAGIEFRGCYYSCDEAVARGWFVRSSRGTFSVEVSYDRRLVDKIYVHDDQNPGQMLIASLLEKSADFAGLSFQEAASIHFRRERLRQKGERVGLRQHVAYHQAVDPITKAAHAEAKRQSKGKSRSARKADIREQREEERSLERQEKAALAPRREREQSAEIVPLRSAAPKPVSSTTSRNAKLLDMLNGN